MLHLEKYCKLPHDFPTHRIHCQLGPEHAQEPCMPRALTVPLVSALSIDQGHSPNAIASWLSSNPQNTL
jgi:hypothetical protein